MHLVVMTAGSVFVGVDVINVVVVASNALEMQQHTWNVNTLELPMNVPFSLVNKNFHLRVYVGVQCKHLS